jgi:hypothetical protein
MDINTILHTKDGSCIGNAIITGRDENHWEVTTDYGNKVRLTSEEINGLFNIAFADLYDCDGIQESVLSTHKHRVNL